MKKFVLATIAAGTLLSAPAFAADMAVKARPPALAPAYDWSGFYIGGDLGWQGSRIGLSSPLPGDPLSYTPNHDGFAGGGFVGIQKQFNQVVVGIEGSYLAATGHESFGTASIGSIFTPGGTATAQAKLKDLWSIGGRVGLPFGQWMPYVAGGYGSGSFQLNAQNTVGVITEAATSRNERRIRRRRGGLCIHQKLDHRRRVSALLLRHKDCQCGVVDWCRSIRRHFRRAPTQCWRG